MLQWLIRQKYSRFDKEAEISPIVYVCLSDAKNIYKEVCTLKSGKGESLVCLSWRGSYLAVETVMAGHANDSASVIQIVWQQFQCIENSL